MGQCILSLDRHTGYWKSKNTFLRVSGLFQSQEEQGLQSKHHDISKVLQIHECNDRNS